MSKIPIIYHSCFIQLPQTLQEKGIKHQTKKKKKLVQFKLFLTNLQFIKGMWSKGFKINFYYQIKRKSNLPS